MISPISSSHSTPAAHEKAPAKTSRPAAKAPAKSPPQDTVKLSSKASSASEHEKGSR